MSASSSSRADAAAGAPGAAGASGTDMRKRKGAGGASTSGSGAPTSAGDALSGEGKGSEGAAPTPTPPPVESTIRIMERDITLRGVTQAQVQRFLNPLAKAVGEDPDMAKESTWAAVRALPRELHQTEIVDAFALSALHGMRDEPRHKSSVVLKDMVNVLALVHLAGSSAYAVDIFKESKRVENKFRDLVYANDWLEKVNDDPRTCQFYSLLVVAILLGLLNVWLHFGVNHKPMPHGPLGLRPGEELGETYGGRTLFEDDARA